MKNEIRLHIPEPCTEDWSLMTNTEKGKHCAKCSKEVFDFSSLNTTEVQQQFTHFHSNQVEVCGQFRNDQLSGTENSTRTSPKRINRYMFSALATLLPWFFSSCKDRKIMGGIVAGQYGPKGLLHLKNFNASCYHRGERTAGSIVIDRDTTIRVDSLSLNKNLFCKVTFSTNEYLVSDDGKNTLVKFAAELKKMKDISIEIIGHADTVGSMKQNKILSEKRAEEVKALLTKEGITVDICRGVGYQYPVLSNVSMTGRAANRRVEIKVLLKGKSK